MQCFGIEPHSCSVTLKLQFVFAVFVKSLSLRIPTIRKIGMRIGWRKKEGVVLVGIGTFREKGLRMRRKKERKRLLRKCGEVGEEQM